MMGENSKLRRFCAKFAEHRFSHPELRLKGTGSCGYCRLRNQCRKKAGVKFALPAAKHRPATRIGGPSRGGQIYDVGIASGITIMKNPALPAFFRSHSGDHVALIAFCLNQSQNVGCHNSTYKQRGLSQNRINLFYCLVIRQGIILHFF